jgi:putative transposase
MSSHTPEPSEETHWESVRVRNQRRRELSSILHDRQQLVDSLLQLKKGATPKEIHENAATPSVSAARIKRYRNE